MRTLSALGLLALSLAAWAAGAEEAAPAPSPLSAEVRVLQSGEVDRYVAALRELVPLGLDAASQIEGDRSDLQQRATAMRYDAKMRSVLARHDFAPAAFTEVHWNVLLAYVSASLGEHNEELRRARAEQQAALAEMKAQLPPEQYEAAMQMMGAMAPMLSAAEAVPDANRALVAARRAELDAIFTSAERASE